MLYSFGVNGESSFEAEVLEKTNCRAYGYDFSVQSWGYVFIPSLMKLIPIPGRLSLLYWRNDFDDSLCSFSFDRPEINNVARLRARSHFGAYMLAGDDDHTASPPRWTLKSLMKLNGTSLPPPSRLHTDV